MARTSEVHLSSVIHSRPVLCSEVAHSSMPVPERLEFLNKNNSSDSYDALAVSVHVLLLEIGFHPVGVANDIENHVLPENWKSQDIYKLSYYHESCCDIIAEIIGVKVSPFLAIFAKVKNGQKTNPNEYNLHLLVKDYIRNGSSSDKPKYYNLPKLSQTFKDNIGLRLIMECQEEAGMIPNVGFSSLLTEVKMHILSYLDAESLLKVGHVNKELNELANQEIFWKKRYICDFPNLHFEFNRDDCDYKLMYRKAYLDRKKQQKVRSRFVAVIPHVGPWNTMRTELQEQFPRLLFPSGLI